MIRLATEQDAPAIRAIYAPIVERTAISFETEPPSAEEMRRRIAATLSVYPWLVQEDERRILSYAYAGPHRARPAYRWSVDVTVYVAPDAHRRGIGRSLYTALFEVLQRQRFHAAFAGITLPNQASVGLHEAVGFAPVGIYRSVGFKLGAWHDVGWWQRPLGPTALSPSEPSLLEAVAADPALASYWRNR